ncbi:alpha/beta hydrolase [Pseudobutyrivibrio sp. LB2011]|uniref:alpha/beta hydrolase n=1 Tax=Pseudobutyrivibrio sp. LB2011 TaxID=1408312 RepID=UPI0005D20866|nr:alpha/beta fold hydrolase [Pseudobutyrivibrio sp. LB2011]
MFITDDGIKLNAKLDMPTNGATKCPLCLVFHGFTGHIEEDHILAVSKGLNEVGVATLRVDLYGHGNSDGEFKNHNLYKWLNNILTVVDYAKTLDFVTEMYMCGHSQGGLAVTLAAAMERDTIKALIPLSPAYVIIEGAKQGDLLGQPFDPDNIPDMLQSWDGRELSGNYIRVAQSIDLDAAIKKYSGPVLIVHGDADEAVPVEYGIEASKKFANCTLKLIPGDTHCYDHHLDQAVEAVKEFVKGL